MSIQDKDLSDIWDLTLKIVQPDIKKLSFDAILRNSSLESIKENTAVVKVQNDFAKDWLSARYTGKIEDALRDLIGTYCKVEYTVAPQSKDGNDKAEGPAAANRVRRQKIVHEKAPSLQDGLTPPTDAMPDLPGRKLREKLTFDRYHVGDYNEIAYRYVIQMLNGENKLPVLIYSSVGMGKTHLLQAAAWRMLENNPGAKVAYISGEDFTNQLIESLNNKSMPKFREQYKNLDMLLVDDIQFFEGKKATQDEFFFTFNTLLEGNKLIILSSDKHPGYLENFQDRLHSRMKSTQIANIMPTTYEDRISLQQKWAQNIDLTLPAYFYDKIATRITDSIRELEAAFNNIRNRMDFHGWGKATSELVDSLLDEFSPGTKKQTVTVARIQKAVADYYKVDADEMNGTSRVKSVSDARQCAMYLCREMLKMPLESIGREFGGRDHATVLHACRKVKSAAEENSTYKASLNEIRDTLKV